MLFRVHSQECSNYYKIDFLLGAGRAISSSSRSSLEAIFLYYQSRRKCPCIYSVLLFCFEMARVGGFSNSDNTIYLNVYDLHVNNSILYQWGLGFYHSGVQIGRNEYTFGETIELMPSLSAFPVMTYCMMLSCV